MYAYDVSFDVKEWDKIMNVLRKKNPGILVIGYGHIGDGNIHINICVKQGQKVLMTEE
jgi:FAD/FMN-containing dehydrogenase